MKKVDIISDKDLPKFDLISEIPKKKDVALPFKKSPKKTKNF